MLVGILTIDLIEALNTEERNARLVGDLADRDPG
jgi:hypothetical protein